MAEEMHDHGRGYSHQHAHSEIRHGHMLRAICMLAECRQFGTHNIHPSSLAEREYEDDEGKEGSWEPGLD